jgi:hypothetical protein
MIFWERRWIDYLTCTPIFLKNWIIGPTLIGTLISNDERQPVYISYSVSGSFGVNGFLIDLVSGNIGVDFFNALAVLAPKPKIAKFVTLA